jgi:EmrB/QacA subfamily drug resistance transporter
VIESDQRRAALLVAGCFFMEMLDGTIVTTSAPKIAAALSAPVGAVSVIITAYLVTLATLIPLSAWLAARFGARRIFIGGIALFTVASLACALAQSLPELVAARVLQGAGGAMMVPVGRFVVLRRAAKSDLLRVTAYLVWPGLIAPVIAPLAGGLITTYASWRWLFLINVPLGALGILAARKVIHAETEASPPPLDVRGVITTALGLGGLTATAALLAEPHQRAVLAIGVGSASLATLVIAVRHLITSARPLIDLGTLRNHTFSRTLGGSSIYFVVIGAVPFLAPLLFMQVFDWSAIKSGALTLFIFVGNVGIKPWTTQLYNRFGFRAVLIAATATQAVAIVVFALAMTSSTPLVLVAALLLVSGCARSVGATAYSSLAFSEVEADEMRHANTLYAIVQQLAGGFGVALAAIALRIGDAVGGAVASRPGPQVEYTIAFVLIALLSLAASLVAGRLRPGAGDGLLGVRSALPAES